MFELGCVGGARLCLSEGAELVHSLLFEVVVGVNIIERFFETCEIVSQMVLGVSEDWACPISSIAAKIGDDEKDFLFVLAVRVRAKSEREGALRNECFVFRKFAVKLGGLVDFRFADRFADRFGDRGVAGALKCSNVFLSFRKSLSKTQELSCRVFVFREIVSGSVGNFVLRTSLGIVRFFGEFGDRLTRSLFCRHRRRIKRVLTIGWTDRRGLA